MTRPINPWKVTGYKAGQNVVCKVIKAEQNGYAVIIPKDNLPGFIQTPAEHRPGEEILAQFVCVHNNRILLSPLFAHSRAAGASLARQSTVNWEAQLDDPNAAQAQDQTGANQQYADQFAPPAQQNAGQPQQDQYQSQDQGQQAQQQQDYSQYGQSATTPNPIAYADPNQQYQQYQQPQQDQYQQDYGQGSTPLTDAVQSQWQAPIEQVPTKRFRLRRAIDLVMPPIDQDSLNTYKMADYDLEWLITDLEGGMRTGCMKSTSEQQLSRSAVLLYRGKAVGCIYGCKSAPDAKPTEESLTNMLSDLNAPDAVVNIYDLPEEVTVAMSALFLGFPVERDESKDAKTQFDYFMNWFTQNGSSSCLAISMPSSKSTCLVFVHKGKFGGSFHVEDQVYTQDPAAIYQLFANDPNCKVEASMLQPEMTASGSRFGYSLSMANKKS